ncbi:MAG: hypothetical protein WA885_21175 [Phormidesmis sp.]
MFQLNKLASENQNIQVFPGLLGAENKENIPLHEAETASSILVEKHVQEFPVTYHNMRTVNSIVQTYFNGYSPDFLNAGLETLMGQV